jgi:Domain of unknown function (DUF6285)
VTEPGWPYGVPTAPQLLEAVVEFLEKEVAGELVGRRRFHLRVAVNVLNIVRRQLEHGDDSRWAGEALASLGVSSEQELAEAIRAGDLDGRADLRDVLRRLVVARLEVNNPTYLETYR